VRITADTITDSQIQQSGADAETIEHAIAVDPNWPGGRRHWARVHRQARMHCADLINARRCPGRIHEDHLLAVCEGQCCTNCGGPIDDNEECRC
jgi:hypothetical protein